MYLCLSVFAMKKECLLSSDVDECIVVIVCVYEMSILFTQWKCVNSVDIYGKSAYLLRTEAKLWVYLLRELVIVC